MIADMEEYEEPMDTSDTPWFWFYQAKCGIWHRIEDDPDSSPSSSELNRHYLRNPHGVLELTTAGGCFRIDFSKKLQTNLITGEKRRIKRSFSDIGRTLRCKCEDQVSSGPDYWERMDPTKPYQKFCLDHHSDEFKKVEKYAREIGLLQKPIRDIYRIQNVDLWELYCRKRTQLMRIKGVSELEEQMLFHGTSRDNVHNICTYNFDCNLSDQRRTAHVFGKGTYFAKHASYADKYSSRESTGFNTLQIMFLARVTVGKYKLGQRDFHKPDGNTKENIHDSSVDDELCPKIFVIFNSNQIYPEYLLEYGR
ncbi:poly ADP-ribose polymerase 11-like [Astyanax mexicanus]|uniref:Poly [ADP-ribose] polymerase n=1 Tax=Astyanax mexicanus TaxID=7994 RepID=A0A8B9K2A8_ASTMX|nr:poly ADP-ribose polymerase 11-like [Astyanax mexicanus]